MAFIVTTTEDSGSDSLRAAIEAANAAGTATINFAIGSGPVTIRPNGPLPPLAFTGSVDGRSQPGYDGTPLVEISGAESPRYIGNVGLSADEQAGLLITGAGLFVWSLAVTDSPGDGVRIRGAGGNGLLGCYIGVRLDGFTAGGNGETGVRIASSPQNCIGGRGDRRRTVIGASGLYGIVVEGPTSANSVITGSHIGCGATGMIAVPNARSGIVIFNAPRTMIGGTYASDRNVISGNTRAGVNLDGSISPTDHGYPTGEGCACGNVVQGNYIGVDASGEGPLPNGLRGVLINYSQSGMCADNVISANGEDGIVVLGPADQSNPNLIPTDNLIVRNRIGVTASGTHAGNARHGIYVQYGSRNLIGTSDPADANTIANNAKRGIYIRGAGWDTNVVGTNVSSGNGLADYSSL